MTHRPLTREARRRLLAHVDGEPAIPGVGTYVWFPHEDELVWSATLVGIYGLDVAPTDEAGLVALVHPEDRTRVQAEISAFLGDGDHYEREFRIVRPDGAVRVIHDRSVIVRDPQGAVLAMRGVNVDVTRTRPAPPEPRPARHHAATDGRLRSVLDQLFAFVGLLSVDGVLLHANRAPLAAAGLEAEDVVGRPFETTYWWSHDPALQVRLVDAMRRARQGERVRFDAVVRVAHGRRMTIDFQVAPHRDDQGVVDGLIASAIDIDERIAAERALAESEARFRAMTDNLPLVVWVHDADGRQLFINETFSRRFGVDRETMGADDWISLTHPDDREAYISGFRRAVETRTRFEAEVRVRLPGGQWRWHRSWAGPRFDAEGRYIGHVGASADVTEEKQAHERLKESEALARARTAEIEAIYDAAPIGIVVFDPDLRFLAINSRLAETNGFEPGAIVGRRAEEVLGEETVAALRAIRHRLLDGHAVDDLEIAFHDSSGRRRTFLVAYTPLRDETGKVARFLGTVLDITDRKAAERRIREKEERLAVATRAAGLGVFEWRLRGDLTIWQNARFGEILGLGSMGEAPRPSTVRRAIVHPDDRESFEAVVARAAESGEPFELTCRIRRRDDGTERHLEVSGLVEDEAACGDARLVGVALDVTDRVRAEEQRRLLLDELSHRTKNILAIVRSVAMQSLNEGRKPAEQRRLFEARLAALAAANDILVRGDWQKARLRDLVEDTARACGAGAARFAARGPDVLLAPQRAMTMTLAFHELFTNALKYGALSTPEGRVDVTWSLREDDPGGFRLLWVERDGPPVSAPEREGFGSRMLKRALAAELGGPVKLRYERGGLVCEILARAPYAPVDGVGRTAAR